MANDSDQNKKKPLSLSKEKRLELKGKTDTGKFQKNLSSGRSKTVTVEVRRRRWSSTPLESSKTAENMPEEAISEKKQKKTQEKTLNDSLGKQDTRKTPILTDEEKAARARALELALQSNDEERRKKIQAELEEQAKLKKEKELAEERQKQEAERNNKKDEKEEVLRTSEPDVQVHDIDSETAAAKKNKKIKTVKETEKQSGTVENKPVPKVKREERRRSGKLTISQALEDPDEERQRSLASIRRAREKAKTSTLITPSKPAKKMVREVVVPEAITVQDLANRMAEKGSELIKVLMKMGMMMTINQYIDADTAELVAGEFGHKVKRVSESDVEDGLEGEADKEEELEARPPVVTVMGHVDHGKTSLLDALRKENVVSTESGGITQHIGAYQVKTADNKVITFIDTPGHEAFTEMRARGTNITDIVVLVVAADDGIQPQTIEAIAHAKAAEVPIIVAINKIDAPGAEVDRIRTDLLNHEIQIEDFGGEVLCVDVSAKQQKNLDKLIEAILLQSEMLDIKANPNREAQGVAIEASLDKGRGPVATILIRKGTLNIGDIFVVGSQWGKVRAMVNEKGEQIKKATPSMPVEILGLNGTPSAGDSFSVVESEARAREITDFRQRKLKEIASIEGKTNLEQMFSNIAVGEVTQFPVLVKADVQGSTEAICASLEKLSNEEINVQVIHSGAGVINETDVSLANASKALIVGFNVRPTAQARKLAEAEKVDIRFYTIIYDIIEEMKKIMSGMLEPIREEVFLGRAEVRQVFSISKVGKIAGCRVVEGVIKKAMRMNLVRDGVVVYEGHLKSLKHLKDEVSSMKEGYECGVMLENFQDIHVDDVLECYEVKETARTID